MVIGEDGWGDGSLSHVLFSLALNTGGHSQQKVLAALRSGSARCRVTMTLTGSPFAPFLPGLPFMPKSPRLPCGRDTHISLGGGIGLQASTACGDLQQLARG